MKHSIIVLSVALALAGPVVAQDNYIASIDVGAGLITMYYGPSTTTNHISQNGPWVNVYISQAEYQTLESQIQHLPASARVVGFLPAAKVAAAKAAAKDEKASLSDIDPMLRSVTEAILKIGEDFWSKGLTPTKAQVKAYIKAEL